ncbi:MAG: ferrous iron transport protein A [Flammeovirgaceae bacterium]|nr:ferrous iron transport protein A [Flammeovirgaceae bacterium]
MTLDEVSNLSKSYIVTEVKKHPLTTKLVDMGLFSGKEVKLLFKAPFGDPIAIDVQGYTLSLRKEEAALISVA